MLKGHREIIFPYYFFFIFQISKLAFLNSTKSSFLKSSNFSDRQRNVFFKTTDASIWKMSSYSALSRSNVFRIYKPVQNQRLMQMVE